MPGILALQLVLGVACMGRVPGCGGTPEEVERENVLGILSTEDSILVARDGATPIGALFAREHRYALSWDELPEPWIVAIVAAEDGRFWRHSGVDATHVARAARDNLTAGSVVAGGSTLTQQTAKNLFERQGRSIGAKLEELDQAMHLEKVFDKHEILLSYANLFHVTGNGEGLGIAARYFFDAAPDQLDLLQSAYLAGIVKGPANYDPFRGTAEQREEARRRARERTRYVLTRIVEEETDNLVPTSGDRLSKERVEALKAEAQRLLDEDPPIPFARGRFRFPRTVIVDEVEAALDGPYFRDVLERAGITDRNAAGLTVVTAVDPDIQREALYALRHHLTEIGLWLEESEASRLRLEADPPPFAPEDEAVPHTFRRAVVVASADGVEVDLGGIPCAIDEAAVDRIADALHRGASGNRRAEAPREVVAAVRDALAPGTVVEVSVREPCRCDLELVPELQGAVVVLSDGEVRAMVGGTENRDFNRALAKRQLGSTFKPLVYHAALTLGWQPDDMLENQPQTFRFSTTEYAPRPDHAPSPQVSMAWAGVKSENIASVWLLAHLVDRLTPEQITALAADLDLGPGPEESDDAYGKRLRKLGVNLDLKDPVNLELQERVARFAEELRLEGRAKEAKAVVELDPSEVDAVVERAEGCAEELRKFERSFRFDQYYPKRLFGRRSGQSIAVACDHQPAGYQRLRVLFERKGRQRVRKGQLEPNREMMLPEGVTLGTARGLRNILRTSDSEAASVAGLEPTHPRRLKANPDFRWLLALRYVQDLARRYGVTSELPDVMSLPLGSVEISVQEAAMMYAGITSGSTAKARATGIDGVELPPPPTPSLILEIRDAEDRVVFRATPDPDRVSRPAVGAMTADILRNVVEHGTGQRAKWAAVEAGSARVPLGGKTGTTNDFKNAAFVGFVPGSTREGFVAAEGHTVASYVGYDDNRPMERGNIRIAGSSGALPAWIGTVEGIARAHPPAAPTGVEPVGGVWPLDASGVVQRSVDPGNGLPGSGATVLVAQQRQADLPGAAPKPVQPAKEKSRSRQRRFRLREWLPF